MDNEKVTIKNREEKLKGVRRVSENLHSAPEHITLGSDVSSEPFPFSEEENPFYETRELKGIERNITPKE